MEEQTGSSTSSQQSLLLASLLLKVSIKVTRRTVSESSVAVLPGNTHRQARLPGQLPIHPCDVLVTSHLNPSHIYYAMKVWEIDHEV